MVFLNPLASTLKVWMVFFFVLNILFKSIWAWCEGHSYILNTQKAFLNIPNFTIVSLLRGCMSYCLSVPK